MPSKKGSNSGNLHIWQIRAVRDLFWLTFAIFLMWMGYYLRSIFTPVLIGLALAYLFNPLFHYLEKRFKVSRPISIISAVVLLVIVSALLMIWLLPIVVQQVTTLANKIPQYLTTVGEQRGWELERYADQLSGLLTQARENPAKVIRTIFAGTSQAFGFLGSVLGTTTYVLLSTFLVLVYFAFFAWNTDSIFEAVKAYLPKTKKKRILEVVGKMDGSVSSFFRSRVIIALLMGLMFAVGWMLAGVPYWFLLGFGTGFLSLIPYLSAVGWPLAVLLKYLESVTGASGSGLDLMAVIFWPSLVYVVVQFIESWGLTPWLQGQSTNLNPITILLVVFVGGALGGLYGLLLAIPIAACLKIFMQEVLLPYIAEWAKEN